MKTRTWAACLVCILVGFGFSSLSQPQSNGQDKAANPGQLKWEYKIVHSPDVTLKRLNELGGEGWELVAVPDANGFETYYMKRRGRVNPPAPPPDTETESI